MALTNNDRISRMLETIGAALENPVGARMAKAKGSMWVQVFIQNPREAPEAKKDPQVLLKAIDVNWNDVFGQFLGRTERSIAVELRELRNRWAHNAQFTYRDTDRALDSAQRLLEAFQCKKEADAIGDMLSEVRRTQYAEEARTKLRAKTPSFEGMPKAGLKPWREVVTPHKDVMSRGYAEAKFAADLAQVIAGEGEAEYRDPREFFARTYLTYGLSELLKGAILRLNGQGGAPVVELQTNFGGGKTHSMLALYHLTGFANTTALPGVEDLLKSVGVPGLPRSARAVLVGTALNAGQRWRKPDGSEIGTLWGELAHQLGGRESYQLVAENDRNGIAPGSNLLAELLKRHAPGLVLIDEWVAFVRQLYHNNDTAAGSFDSNVTFVQALTEAASRTAGALVVASLPVSEIEIGGEGGREALRRIKNVFSRVETSWKPATADEGFEIVRRRLFQPITDRDAFAYRDAVIKAYGDMYRTGQGEFPTGSGEGDYKRRMEAAYPIHPELFDRLYSDWGSLDKFQRTRGVLRLMASVIHQLWEGQDGGLLILPASVPLDHPGIESELTRYLSPEWDAVIAADVDGPASKPLAIDQDVPTLGRYSATRRVARAIFIGSAPSTGPTPGIDDKRIRLGCVQPGESAATFGDALRRLADQATFLYQDGGRYWLSTKASVTRLAADRAGQYYDDDIDAEIVRLVQKEAGDRRSRGDFAAVHAIPKDSSEVPDEMEARLVVLGPDYPYTKGSGSAAEAAAETILNTRGNGQRIYRNTLLFLAADAKALAALRDAVRQWLAWSSITADEKLDLGKFERKQAEQKRDSLEETVASRIQEAWSVLLVPTQADPKGGKIVWSPSRLSGKESLAIRASKKAIAESALYPGIGPANLCISINQHIWEGADHIGTRKLWEYLASYLYLPRLRDQHVLLETMRTAISGLVCDAFAYAGRYDEAKKRYEGLRTTGGGATDIDPLSVIVKPAVAAAQQAAEAGATTTTTAPTGGALPFPPGTPNNGGFPSPPGSARAPKPIRRYFATVALDPDRASRDMGKIAEEVLQHLTTLPGGNVTLTLEIAADLPDGIPDDTQRIVRENGTVLKFRSQGFEH
jgi:predicted AAA+ superfamily ATPase